MTVSTQPGARDTPPDGGLSTMPGGRDTTPPVLVDELVDAIIGGDGSAGVAQDSTLTDRGLCGGAVTPRTIVTAGIDASVILKDGTLDITPFASGITPVQVVSSLPTCGASEDGEVAFLTTDGQLYRCDGAAWQVMTPDGSNIVANTITAGQIAAGAIGTSELAADAVTADAIAAGEVYVEHLVAGSFDNLVSNPIFEADTINGADDPHVYAGNGGTWSTATTTMHAGTRCARFDRDSQTSNAIIVCNGTTGSAAAMADHFHAVEDDECYFSYYVRDVGTGTHPLTRARVLAYDLNGAFLTSGESAWTAGGSGAYVKVEATHTMPADTAYVVFRIEVRFDAGDSSTAATLFDSMYGRRMVNNAIVASDISAAKITADELTGRLVRTAASGTRLEIEGVDENSTLYSIDWYEGSTLVGQSWYSTSLNRFQLATSNNRLLSIISNDGGDLLLATEAGGDISVELNAGADVFKVIGGAPSAAAETGLMQVNTDQSERCLTLYNELNTYTGSIFVILADEEQSGATFRFLRTQDDADGTPNTAHDLEGNGDGNCDGSWSGGGADYAELFETVDGQPIEPGFVVALDGDRIRLATHDHGHPLGVVSASPAFVGNNGLNWHGKYQTDEWGRRLTTEAEWVEWHDLRIDCTECGRTTLPMPDEKRAAERLALAHHVVHCPNHAEAKGGCPMEHVKVSTSTKRHRYRTAEAPPAKSWPAHAHTYMRTEGVLSPDFDPARDYQPRKNRDEWVAVGLVGRLRVRDDGTCEPNGYAEVGKVAGELTAAVLGPWRVMRRIAPKIVEVLVR